MKRILQFWSLVLVLMLICGCTADEHAAGESGVATPNGIYSLEEGDPLGISEIVIGDSAGEAKKIIENGKVSYCIYITLPAETDFKNCIANITLPAGAKISEESPCLRADLGGRPVLDLSLEVRDLIIENGGETRAYRFTIDIE